MTPLYTPLPALSPPWRRSRKCRVCRVLILAALAGLCLCLGFILGRLPV